MDSQHREVKIETPETRFRGVPALLSWCLVIALIWGIVLPRVAKIPRVQARSHWLQQQGIDASAMFYTELDSMGGILKRLEGGRPSDHRESTLPTELNDAE